METRCGDVVAGPSRIAGRGVFAGRAFASGELVERCPILRLDGSAWRSSAVLFDHAVTVSTRPLRVVLPLGYGALYNHADSPNASWSVDPEAAVMEVEACRDIAPGEEILIYYGREFSAGHKAAREQAAPRKARTAEGGSTREAGL
ncbi:SET domain-containing protein-lysine N-methyltransferase [Streptomyces sp. NPDC004788]